MSDYLKALATSDARLRVCPFCCATEERHTMMRTTDELRPRKIEAGLHTQERFVMVCDECGGRGPPSTNEQAALLRWRDWALRVEGQRLMRRHVDPPLGEVSS